MDVNREALDKFGQYLIQEIRDTSISWGDALLDGKVKAPFLREMHKKIVSSLSAEQLDIVNYLVPMIVDQVLFEFLVRCEYEEWFNISVKTDSGVVPTLRGAGDGMQGDLFNWIREYSKERYNYLDEGDEFNA